MSAVRVGVALGLIGACSTAQATEIRWTGDSSCRREVEVAEQVAAMTGREVSSIDNVDFELDAQPTSNGTWRLELKGVRRLDGSDSLRSLQGNTCVEVTDAAAVAIALAVGPQADLPESQLQAKPAVSRVATAPPPARPQAILRPRPSSLVWFAGLAFALDSSVTPNVALGGSVRLGLRWLPSRASETWLRFELEGALYAPSERVNSNGKGGKFQLGSVAPLVCGEKPIAGNALLGCLGYEIGQLSGEGSGAAVSAHRRDTLWYAARAELGLLVPLGTGLSALARGGAAVPLVRRNFVLDGSEVVFRPAALTFRAEFGLELSL